MRHTPNSWTDSTLTALGFRRLSSKERRRRAAQRGRRLRVETLEERRVLDGAAEELVRPEWVLASRGDDDTTEQYSVSTEYSAQGAVAVVALKPGLESYDVSLQELVLELRLGKTVVSTQTVAIDLAETDFRGAFLADRVRIATAETDAASLSQTQVWLGKIDAAGEFSDLKPADGAERGAADSASIEAAARLAAIAKREATDGDAVPDVGASIGLYRAIDRAIDETATARQAVATQADQDALDAQTRQLGNAALLLASRLGEDALSSDPELSAAARSLQDKMLGATDSYFTVFAGLGRNQVLGERESVSGRFTLAAVEELSYQASPSLRIELGGQSAFVETSSAAARSSQWLASAANSSYGDLLGDAYADESDPITPYGSYDDQAILAGDFGVSGAAEAYLQYDLAGQMGKRVSEGVLQLATIDWGGAGNNLVISAHRDLFGLTASSDFNEQTLTWDNRSAIFGGISGVYDENFTAPLSAWEISGADAAFDVTEAIKRATIAGDSNLNGAIDLAGWRGDVEAFYLAVHDWETYVEIYRPQASSETDLLYANDINWDGVVDGADWDWMRQRLGLRRGDVTFNDVTDASDLSRWSANFGKSTAFGYGGYSSGDGNFDGYIDAGDYSAIRDYYGSSSELDPLLPSVTFRIAAAADNQGGYAEFASSENTSEDAPALLVTHNADVEVTEFATHGTDLMLRYSVWNAAFTGLTAKIYREINGDLEANPAMTVPLSSLGVGKHTKRFTATLNDTGYADRDYRLVVVLEGTTASIAETDLADNEAHFAGGVFVNVYGGVSTVHVHGTESADAISITNDGVEIVGERGAVYRFGTGSGPSFVDDDGGPALSDSRSHVGGLYQATAGISSPLVNHASTWGNDREIAYPSNNTQAELATWTFPNLAPGVYQISAVWQGHSNRATDATYRIFDGDDMVGVEHRSHKEHSSWTGDGIAVHTETHDDISATTGFKDIGSPLTTTSGTLRVELPNALLGQVVADAIRLERVDVVDPLTSGGIVIRGQGGDDEISAATDVAFALIAFGGDGDDILQGGAGADILFGGDGDDTLIGGAGDDELWGDLGHDMLSGGLGADSLFGGAGDEILYGGEGDDLLHGGDGSDTLVGNAGNDSLIGGQGHDRLIRDSADANQPPEIEPLAAPYAIRDRQTIGMRIRAEDDQTPYADLTFAASISGPVSVPQSQYNAAGGVFEWEPVDLQAGLYSVTITAFDSHNASSSHTFDVDIISYNAAPPVINFIDIEDSYDGITGVTFEYVGGQAYSFVYGSSGDAYGLPIPTVLHETAAFDSQTASALITISGATSDGTFLAIEPASSGRYSITATDAGVAGGSLRSSSYATFIQYSELHQLDWNGQSNARLLLTHGLIAPDIGGLHVAVGSSINTGGIASYYTGVFGPLSHGLREPLPVTTSFTFGSPESLDLDTSQGSVGALSNINANDGTFTFTPASGFEGLAKIPYWYDFDAAFLDLVPSPTGSGLDVLNQGGGTSNMGYIYIEVGEAVHGYLTLDDGELSEGESTPSLALHVNSDGDNGSGTIDSSDFIFPSYAENDLTKINLSYWLRGDAYEDDYLAYLKLTGAQVRLWDSSTKANEIIPETKWLLKDLPEIVWLEGISGGAAELSLYIDGPDSSLFTGIARPHGVPQASTSDIENVSIAVYDFDLDIDSNNSGEIEGSLWEETLEDHLYGMGKLIWQTIPPSSQLPPSANPNEFVVPYTPVVLRLGAGLDAFDPNLTVSFDFEASEAGDIRLWNKQRTVDHVTSNTGLINASPHELPPEHEIDRHRILKGQEYKLYQLFYDSELGTATLYIDGTLPTSINTRKQLDELGNPDARIVATFHTPAGDLQDEVKYIVTRQTTPTVFPRNIFREIQSRSEIRSALTASGVYDLEDLKQHSLMILGDDSLHALGIGKQAEKLLGGTSATPGFKAAVYYDYNAASSGHLILAFAGTTFESLEDWAANMAQGLGQGGNQYNAAMTIAYGVAGALANDPDNVSISQVTTAGHSLGGGLASAAALVGGFSGNTFNSAGLVRNTVVSFFDNQLLINDDIEEAEAAALTRYDTAAQYLAAYTGATDILTFIQDNSILQNAIGDRRSLSGPWDDLPQHSDVTDAMEFLVEHVIPLIVVDENGFLTLDPEQTGFWNLVWTGVHFFANAEGLEKLAQSHSLYLRGLLGPEFFPFGQDADGYELESS